MSDGFVTAPENDQPSWRERLAAKREKIELERALREKRGKQDRWIENLKSLELIILSRRKSKPESAQKIRTDAKKLTKSEIKLLRLESPVTEAIRSIAGFILQELFTAKVYIMGADDEVDRFPVKVDQLKLLPHLIDVIDLEHDDDLIVVSTDFRYAMLLELNYQTGRVTYELTVSAI